MILEEQKETFIDESEITIALPENILWLTERNEQFEIVICLFKYIFICISSQYWSKEYILKEIVKHQ